MFLHFNAFDRAIRTAMALKLINLFATCAILILVLDQQTQGAPHEDNEVSIQNLGRVRRQAEEETVTFPPEANWTACDVNIHPILSCHDCKTRLICKPVGIGGFLRPCKGTLKPHCNGGICSAIPSPDCIGV